MKQWPNRDGSRYVVFIYKTNKYNGDIISSEEGDVYWVKLDDMVNMKLTDGMKQMLRVFLEDDLSEYFRYQNDGKWIDELK